MHLSEFHTYLDSLGFGVVGTGGGCEAWSLGDSEDPVLDHLVLSYSAWCERENLPHISMDELICEDITKEQRKQLTAFYLLWEELS